MKNKLLPILIGITLLGCSTPEDNNVLYEKHFIKDNPDWIPNEDTLKQRIVFKTSQTQIPLQLKWTTATDENNCHRIAYLQVERTDETSDYKISNITISREPCSTKWQSIDTTKFENIYIKGRLEHKSGIIEHIYDGVFASINGLSEVKVQQSDI